LKPESYFELDRFVTFLKDLGDATIQISGHTDNIGSTEYNRDLSEKRANAVKTYLKSKGIDNSMKINALGASKPIVPNDTEENRAKNRRVEISVLNK
jgi:OOP family OmpA-OmpF porin